ncbi:uncharacterized protein LOC107048925 [Diachasma alloeum]|uniref:uncharacterized protein LOC107048925 n=1 Tax=Diachasma alloeum TaxID=454923 RepID=UPI0007385008|nr:uncharacterized protein LOC107048925 [Diachasma alloeum]XP_015127861.1 uncharacterized protein LOC107048925 [Diachasma alloeum]
MRNRNKDSVLDEAECLEIVRKKLLKEKMEDYSLVEYELVPMDGSTGFMGQYFTLKATVSSADSPPDTRIINFFTKIPPPEDSPQGEVNQEFGSFKKEVALYTELFPEVLRGLDQYSIPEYFFGLDGDVIVLEDMMAEGYTMKNKLDPFDFDHCKIVLTTLAKFHAKSMIFEELSEKNLLEEFPHCMHETLYSFKGRGHRGLQAAVGGALAMIDLLDSLGDTEKIKFKERIVSMAESHVERLGPSKKLKNVLCHGDLWANNLLFKYGEGGTPDACCLIDFQLARYNPPAHDILCFFQFSTTRQLREKHGPELFKIYHDHLSKTLTDAGLDPERIFPLKVFLDSIEELRTFCMLHGVLNTPLMLLEAQAIGNLFEGESENIDSLLFDDRRPLVLGQFHGRQNYRERMTEALLELHDRLLR